MSSQAVPPRLDADLAAVVSLLQKELQQVLAPGLFGLYLSGSLVAGDFSPDRSDLDLVAVTGAELTPAEFVALTQVHRRFDRSASPWRTEVEVTYVCREALVRFHDGLGNFAHLGRGEELEQRTFDRSWTLELHLFREHAVPLIGPAPRDIVDPVTPQELSATAAWLVIEWLEPRTRTPELWRQVGAQSYLVLTACRALHTVETGAIASKQASAQWALHAVDAAWHPVIEAALAWRKTDNQTAGFDEAATVELIQMVASVCRSSAGYGSL